VWHVSEHLCKQQSEAAGQSIPAYNGSFITIWYSDLVDLVSKANAATLAPHSPIHNVIILKQEFRILYGQIGNRLEVELHTVTTFLETNLARGFMLWLLYAGAALILLTNNYDYGH
jgi:hypothetical protein